MKNNRPIRTHHVQHARTNSFADYINLIRSNFVLMLIISLVIFSITLVYALTAPDVYRASTVLKISQPQGNILDNPFSMEFGRSSNDLFIANEIETIKNITIREQVAKVIIDSFKTIAQTDKFDLILNHKNDLFGEDEVSGIKSDQAIAALLSKNVEITQKNGLNFMEIAAESSSPYEAALIANAYAQVYKDFNLAENRKQFTKIKEFLKRQKEEKLNELMIAENNMKTYLLQGGGIELDQQSRLLVNTLAKFQADRDATQIEMTMLKRTLDELKQEYYSKEPSMSGVFDLQSSEPAIKMLQEEIAKLETQKSIAIAGGIQSSLKKKEIATIDAKIADLNRQLKEKLDVYKSKVFSSTPEELKELSNRIFQTELQYQSLLTKYNQLNAALSQYEAQMKTLPEKTLELARLERDRQSLEKLYLVLEDKYQEALLNEESVPGNVLIMNQARPPVAPERPNRLQIILFGLVFGFVVAFGFIYIKNYFDRTVKTPDDIENTGQNVLAWIPRYEKKIKPEKDKPSELIVVTGEESIAGEAYRALRTRIQFSKITDGNNSILITSSAPQEGKTTVATNLAASFAQVNKKVVVLDCDLRIPRVHQVFNGLSSPGFTNYLFKQASFEDILRKTELDTLFYIAAGTIPTNPSEILSSPQMKNFLSKLKQEFDLVILDAPPVMTITDAEILSHFVDMSILVTFANSTHVDWMLESVDILTRNGQKSFIGIVLNNFDYKSSYRSYNRYNHSKYYSRMDKQKQKEWIESS